MWSEYASRTIKVPSGESALARILAAIHAVDARLEHHAVHIFRSKSSASTLSGDGPNCPFPGCGLEPPSGFRHYFLAGKSSVLNDGTALSASFAPDGTASDVAFGVLVVSLPNAGPQPFHSAPTAGAMVAMVAVKNTIYCFPPSITKLLTSNIPGLSFSKIDALDALRVLPYLGQPRWSLDRVPSGEYLLGDAPPDGLSLLVEMRRTCIDLPGYSDEVLTEDDLRALQRLVFACYAAWADNGTLIHRFFGGHHHCTKPSKAEKIARHPTLRHWLDYALTLRNRCYRRAPEVLREQGIHVPILGSRTYSRAAEDGRSAVASSELTTMKTYVNGVIRAYVTDRFFELPLGLEDDIYSAVDELLDDRGLLTAIITTIADVDADTAYEFGISGSAE